MIAQVYQDLPVLVTGHTGFKGAWLCTVLQDMGAKVYGYALEPEEESLYMTLGLDVASSFADIRDFENVQKYINEVRPRIVFHMAAQALVSVGRENPVETFSTNVMGLVHVLEASVKAGVDSVVVVSTDKVYAPQDVPCTTESPMGGLDPYSASKTAAEFVVAPYRDRLSISIARSGNAIGGGDWAKDRLLPDILRAYRGNTTLQIRHPHATRPWIHVSELILAYLKLGLANLEGRHTEIFNFGARESVSVREVLQLVKQYDMCPTIKYVDHPPIETQQLSLDTQKSADILGWKSILSPQEAIRWTMEEYNAHPSGVRSLMIDRIKYLLS